MNNQVTTKLITASAALARAAPTQWQHFLQALSEHNEERKRELVSSPSDKVFVAQGRAQEIEHLLKTFIDSKSQADQIEQRIQNAPSKSSPF